MNVLMNIALVLFLVFVSFIASGNTMADDSIDGGKVLQQSEVINFITSVSKFLIVTLVGFFGWQIKSYITKINMFMNEVNSRFRELEQRQTASETTANLLKELHKNG